MSSIGCEVRNCGGVGRRDMRVQGPRRVEVRRVCLRCYDTLTRAREQPQESASDLPRASVPRGTLVPCGTRALVLAAVADGVADVATLRQRLDLTSSKAHSALRFLRASGRLCGWDVTDKGREELGRIGGAP